MSDKKFIEEKYELVDINSIEIIEDDRVVYDLEVEEDHTYVLANDIISHNSRAKAGKSMLKEMTHFCGKYRVPFIFTNHTYKDVASAPNPMYAKSVQAGGKQATYMASAVIMLSKKVDKDDNKNKTGSIITMKSDKNRLCRDEQVAQMYLSFTTGPNKFYGLIDDAVEAGIFERVNSKNYIVKETEEKVKLAKMFNKSIFTKDVLDKINMFCNEKYKYATVEYDEEAVEDSVLEENEED
jgi:hypothetical protein